MTQIELDRILEKHRLWLNKNPKGERANFKGKDLQYLSLQGHDLQSVDFRFTNMQYTDLRFTKLQGSNFQDAKMEGAKLEDSDVCYIACPEVGAFIGFKKCKDDKIVKLQILEDSKRSSATTRKCRASKVKVLEITHTRDKEKTYQKAVSNYNSKFTYTVGEVKEVINFDENRWNECTSGIHFFLTREEAELW